MWALLCCPDHEVAGEGVPKQVCWQVGCVGQARLHLALLCASLDWTCPLFLPLSFLTNANSLISRGDSGGVGLCWPQTVEPPVLYPHHPSPFSVSSPRVPGMGWGGEGHRSRHSPQAGSRCPHSHHSPLSSALRSRESTPGSSSAFSHWMPLGVRKARSQGVAPSLPAPQGESLAAALSLSGHCSPGQRPLPPRPHHLPLGTAAMAPVLCQRAPSMALYTTCLSGWEQAVGSALADLWVASPG